ncbi:DUF7657 domain-containing protein [Azospirillum canadense]|uniref:DUF7657 domain-containing protein n=1 Tax=Azospirillum canadense TaxID=403962 RepID=UPI0022271591|nr:hypothetical protein [Azospirillum canadense]MCW2240863.1 hypothetical protein [Azospirillum canadense]
MRFLGRASPSRLFVALVLGLSALYAALAWTPSSYGVALTQMGATDRPGLVAGKPREIRSDEWAVWTPYVQIAVNNHFARHNVNAPYYEDLRNFNALPLWDWALPFKPQYWAFFLVDPAHAYAIYHVAFAALFLIGYQRLARAFGVSPGLSICFSLMMFFTGYTQFAWTTTGPLLAIFPWMLLILFSRLPLAAKGPLLYWIATVWLLSHFYPPIILSLGFAGVVLVLALRRDVLRWSELAVAAVAAGLAAGTTYAYLAEPLQVMAATVYPGQRHSDGGSGDWRIWLSTVLPFITTRGFDSLIVHNLVETGAMSSYWPLLLLVFADWRSVARNTNPQLSVALGVLLAGIALATAWMLLPIPSWVGMPLLWDRVFPPRMIVIIGLMALVATAVLAKTVDWRITHLRVGLFTATVLMAWLISKWLGGVAPWTSPFDGVILVVLAGALALRRWAPALPAGTLLASAAAATNLFTFGQFNPIQSAKPIFDRPQTAFSQHLRNLQEQHEKGWLVEKLPLFTGAVLAGWGYHAITHTLIAPQMDFFRAQFPDMPEERFRWVFNRYAHITPNSVAEPMVPYLDQIHLPRDAVAQPPQARKVEVLLKPGPGAPFAPGGSLDEVRVEGGLVRLRGWAPWTGVTPGQGIEVLSGTPLDVVDSETETRDDLLAAFPANDRMLAGFRVTLRSPVPLEKTPLLCVLAHGTDGGTIILNDARPDTGCSKLGAIFAR